MATITEQLEGGLLVGETLHKEVELREVTARDLIEAQQAGEKVVMVSQRDGSVAPELVSSPVTVGLEVLARQIVRIGSHEGPMTIDELKQLKSAEDLGILQRASEKLTLAGLKALDQTSKEGRS